MSVPAPARAASTRVGVYFGLLQLVFNLSWVIYVIYLPQLAAQAGIAAWVVPWILVADQLIFLLCDWAAGLASDSVAKTLGRLGKIIALVTAISALAFLLLPLATDLGAGLFLVLTATWAITSSALRAPPLTLIGRYTPPDQQPMISSLFLLGLGISGAVAPFLGEWATAYDPRIMFAASSLSVVVVTGSIVWAEKALARSASPVVKQPLSRIHRPPFTRFLAAVLLLALAYQVHAFINSGPLFSRFAGPDELPDLLSVFWIGFSVAMLPASWLTKRFGGVAVMAAGAVIAAAAAWVAKLATDLLALSAAQFVCGCAWGAVTMSAVAAALRLGHGGREGTVVGAMYSVLAAAALVRIAVVAAGFDHTSVSALLWLPVTTWLVGGLLLASATRRLAAGPERG
ncbi:MFS transporter [Mycobacterium sp. ENV421]|uniref:MFS transporter n=1 Tax=Mycobacterium sp. ENV421 TaxID=1213407 RepID=UPI00115B5521|nr:MFS transporter [Mycobacterium sp. ENV421]